MARRPSSEEIRFTIRQRNIAASTGGTCQRMYVTVGNEWTGRICDGRSLTRRGLAVARGNLNSPPKILY